MTRIICSVSVNVRDVTDAAVPPWNLAAGFFYIVLILRCSIAPKRHQTPPDAVCDTLSPVLVSASPRLPLHVSVGAREPLAGYSLFSVPVSGRLGRMNRRGTDSHTPESVSMSVSPIPALVLSALPLSASQERISASQERISESREHILLRIFIGIPHLNPKKASCVYSNIHRQIYQKRYFQCLY